MSSALGKVVNPPPEHPSAQTLRLPASIRSAVRVTGGHRSGHMVGAHGWGVAVLMLTLTSHAWVLYSSAWELKLRAKGPLSGTRALDSEGCYMVSAPRSRYPSRRRQGGGRAGEIRRAPPRTQGSRHASGLAITGHAVSAVFQRHGRGAGFA